MEIYIHVHTHRPVGTKFDIMEIHIHVHTHISVFDIIKCRLYIYMCMYNCPFMTNNKNIGKRIRNQNHTCTIHRNTTNS
jgi:hypothetical protein